VEEVGSLITLERGDHRVSSSIAVTGDLEEGDERLAFHAVATGSRLERAGKTGPRRAAHRSREHVVPP
jgi:hypothetical protein